MLVNHGANPLAIRCQTGTIHGVARRVSTIHERPEFAMSNDQSATPNDQEPPTQETLTLEPRVIVFDWDGTLMDSIGNMVDCVHEAFRDLGMEPPPAQTIRGAIGLGLDEVTSRILPANDSATRAQIIGRYRTLWMDDYRHRIMLFDGVVETLDALASRGHRLAIATGRSRGGLDHALEVTGLASRFETTRTVNEAPAKPDPQMLLDVLEAMAVAPASACMVGDTTYDLNMARQLDVRAIGVLYGSHLREDLIAHAPDALIERIDELPAVVLQL